MTTETIQQPVKPAFKLKIFKDIDLTKVIEKAKKTQKIPIIIKKGKVKVSKNYVEIPDRTIDPNLLLKSQPGSVQRYLDECHPDIKTFIFTNRIMTIKAGLSELTIITSNNFKIHIKTVGEFRRKVVITDKQRNVLLDTVTSYTYKKQENENNIPNSKVSK